MKSRIISKLQITVARKIREEMKLSTTASSGGWRGLTVVEPIRKTFVQYRVVISAGKGDFDKDI